MPNFVTPEGLVIHQCTKNRSARIAKLPSEKSFVLYEEYDVCNGDGDEYCDDVEIKIKHCPHCAANLRSARKFKFNRNKIYGPIRSFMSLLCTRSRPTKLVFVNPVDRGLPPDPVLEAIDAAVAGSMRQMTANRQTNAR